jgi:Uma2 family endonuclease
MAAATIKHGYVAMGAGSAVRVFVDQHQLGWVVTAEASFIVSRNPDTVLIPDAAFIQTSQLSKMSDNGFFDGAPDLVIEVVSPSDRVSRVVAKVDRWLAAGAQSVWIIDPPNKRLDAYHADGSVQRLKSTDTLNNDPCLRGFSLKLEKIFPPTP